MADESKTDKKIPDEIPIKTKEKKVKDNQDEKNIQTKETENENIDEPSEKENEEASTEESKVIAEAAAEEKIDKPKKEGKAVEAKAKKDDKQKKDDKKPDFKYIVRLSNSDINGEKSVLYGLTSVKGIGLHMATLIIDETGIDRYLKIGDLKDAQIEKLQEMINNITEKAPGWMLNHRKDYDTGEDQHIIGPEIEIRLRDEINIMKKIRSYRGIRHERGLPVRGQRTRANNRKGLSLGVSKKKVVP